MVPAKPFAVPSMFLYSTPQKCSTPPPTISSAVTFSLTERVFIIQPYRPQILLSGTTISCTSGCCQILSWRPLSGTSTGTDPDSLGVGTESPRAIVASKVL